MKKKKKEETQHGIALGKLYRLNGPRMLFSQAAARNYHGEHKTVGEISKKTVFVVLEVRSISEGYSAPHELTVNVLTSDGLIGWIDASKEDLTLVNNGEG